MLMKMNVQDMRDIFNKKMIYFNFKFIKIKRLIPYLKMSELISIEKIPDWLKNSIFYQNLDKEDIFIPIPKDKFENEIKINNKDNLYKYLEIVRYWMIINCPYEIYDYIKLNQNIIDLSYIKEKFYDLSFFDEFIILCST